jgi:hypothetical protein
MRAFVSISLLLAAFGLAPAGATDVHNYAKGEYLTIRGGLAPNKQLALAAHGGDEEGNGDPFHVWLMAEPGHRKLVRLSHIGDDNILDTGPGAYHAFWSQDSRRVGIVFRSSRHEVTLNLYRIDGRRAQEIAGPSLFKEVTSREVTEDDGLRVRNAIVEWHAGNRFVVREFLAFVVDDDDKLTKLLGKFGTVTGKPDGGKISIQFFAHAECELLPDNSTRVIDLTPGKPGDADTWWDQPRKR